MPISRGHTATAVVEGVKPPASNTIRGCPKGALPASDVLSQVRLRSCEGIVPAEVPAVTTAPGRGLRRHVPLEFGHHQMSISVKCQDIKPIPLPTTRRRPAVTLADYDQQPGAKREHPVLEVLALPPTSLGQCDTCNRFSWCNDSCTQLRCRTRVVRKDVAA